MRFLYLVYGADDAWRAPPGGGRLHPAETATTVRVRDGGTEIVDGPHAGTDDRLGGYVVVDCDSLDDAIELAEALPLAAAASVEIRPLAE